MCECELCMTGELTNRNKYIKALLSNLIICKREVNEQ